METKEFEKILEQMTKPEVLKLEHESAMAKEIIKMKDKAILTGWWLSIPVYVILMLLMKTAFMHGTTLYSNIHEFAQKQPVVAAIFLIAVPIVFIVMNAFSIKKIYFLSGSPKGMIIIEQIWFSLLSIIISILILLLYLI